jgi:hypothetical protein
VILAIRKYFLLSASIFRYPQVFSAIRKYSPLSASIFRYPQVFSAIRKYFLLSASIFCYPQVFSAIRKYSPLSVSIPSPTITTNLILPIFINPNLPFPPTPMNMLLLSGKKLKGECCKSEKRNH